MIPNKYQILCFKTKLPRLVDIYIEADLIEKTLIM